MSTTTRSVEGSPNLRRVEGPTKPGAVEAQGWKATAKRTLLRAKQDRISTVAGSIAYYGFMALFPLAIALLGIAGLVHIGGSQLDSLVKGLGKALPQGASQVLTTAVKAAQHRTSGALGATIAGIAVALWSASSGMSTVETALDVAYGVPQSQSRKFLASRFRGIFLLAITVVLGGGASILIVFAKPLGHAIEQQSPITGTAFNVGWTIVRWVLAVLLITMLFSLLYRYGPKRQPPRWRWLSVGGAMATILWLAISFGFSFYVSALGSYGKTYGALAGVAVLLFWLYLTGLALLLGGQINAELEREAARRRGETGAPPPTEESAPSQDRVAAHGSAPARA